MDPTLEMCYNRIVIELEVRVHNRAPLSQIYECINEAIDLFEEIEKFSLNVDCINSVFILNTLMTYRNRLNEILRPLDMVIPLSTRSRVSSDTDALRQASLRAKQLEEKIAEINYTIHDQGDQMRSWKGSLDRSNGHLETTESTLNKIDNRYYCILM